MAIEVEQRRRLTAMLGAQFGDEWGDADAAGYPELGYGSQVMQKGAEGALEVHQNARFDFLKMTRTGAKGLDADAKPALSVYAADGEGMKLAAAVVVDPVAECGKDELAWLA